MEFFSVEVHLYAALFMVGFSCLYLDAVGFAIIICSYSRCGMCIVSPVVI